jgi:osmotically inducible lipoprotein OsmB
MRTPIRSIFAASTLAAAFLATGCANMSERDKDTAIGAGVGGSGGLVADQWQRGGYRGRRGRRRVVGNQVGKKR